MATYNIDTRHEMVSCPLNPNHQVSSGRYVQHIMNCVKNYDKPVVLCPYNSKHLIMKEMFVSHLRNCPNQNKVIFEMITSSKIVTPVELHSKVHVTDTSVVTGEWDD